MTKLAFVAVLCLANTLIDSDECRKACNWPLVRQDGKERDSRDDVCAGRVTATARADIGATRVRRKAWVRGCVQICDDDRLRAGDLDWESALRSCPGRSAGTEVGMAKQSHRRCDQLSSRTHLGLSCRRSYPAESGCAVLHSF